MRYLTSFLVVLAVSIGLVLTASPAQAQFGGIKDKLKKKAEKKLDEKEDQAIDKATSGKPASDEQPSAEPQEKEAKAAPAAKGGTATAEDMTLYTKYDFIPGDKVIFYDDLSKEEIGEFPSRWNLDNGVFEVAKQGGRNWIMCTDKGSINPKIPKGPLPPKYTVEMDYYVKGPDARGHWYTIQWVNENDEIIGEMGVQDNDHTHLKIGDDFLAQKVLEAPPAAGIHTLRIMATKTTLKCYLDNERIANVPATEGFAPVGFKIYMDPWKDEQGNPMLIGGFRYAEGGKTMKEQLDETGRIVTHGILFDSGSDRIKAESYKTLADIGQFLADTPALRLSIEGHTDSDGEADFNQKLSERRAASVKTYLTMTYKIDGSRLETKGWGESKPIDKNDTAEGKANNRRVELVKL